MTLTRAMDLGLFVTIETADDVFVGVPFYLGDGFVRVDTGMRGRPIIITADDIHAVMPVDNVNPLIER